MQANSLKFREWFKKIAAHHVSHRIRLSSMQIRKNLEAALEKWFDATRENTLGKSSKAFSSVVRSKNVWMLDLIGCGFVAITFPIDSIREAISEAHSSPNDVTAVQCSYEFDFVSRWTKSSWRCVDTLLRLEFRRVKDSPKCSPLHAWPELDRYWLTEPRTFIYVR